MKAADKLPPAPVCGRMLPVHPIVRTTSPVAKRDNLGHGSLYVDGRPLGDLLAVGGTDYFQIGRAANHGRKVQTAFDGVGRRYG